MQKIYHLENSLIQEIYNTSQYFNKVHKYLSRLQIDSDEFMLTDFTTLLIRNTAYEAGAKIFFALEDVINNYLDL